jgi:dephospho-CoA kinase
MKLAITGGVASGKSTVLRIFRESGAFAISADEISRRLTAPGGPLTIKIIEQLGPQYAAPSSPQTIDRARLGRDVFHDKSLRERLEALTHPPIVAEMRRLMEDALSNGSNELVAVEVPLLYEAGLQDMFDKVLVVWCDPETQFSRLKSRLPGLSDNELSERTQSQIPLDEKRGRADYVIDSGKPSDEMEHNVRSLYDSLKVAR